MPDVGPQELMWRAVAEEHCDERCEGEEVDCACWRGINDGFDALTAAGLVVEQDWQSTETMQPEPHSVYRVWDKDRANFFDATPCYGLHNPWWVPRNGFTKQESAPIPMKGTYWKPLKAMLTAHTDGGG